MSNSIIGSHTPNYLSQERNAHVVVEYMNRLLRKHLLKVISSNPTHANIPSILKETGQFVVVERNRLSNTDTNRTPYVAYTCLGGIWYFDAKAFYDKRSEWYALLNDAYATASPSSTRPFYLLKSKLDSDRLPQPLT